MDVTQNSILDWQYGSRPFFFSPAVATQGTAAKSILPIEHNTKVNAFKIADRTTFQLSVNSEISTSALSVSFTAS